LKLLGDVFIGFAALAILFAVIGATGNDIWLASTQWVLIAGVLAVFAVYVRLREMR
jgi:Na+-transporting NADH:ubiquinone oxidoreductase subunit NqrB